MQNDPPPPTIRRREVSTPPEDRQATPAVVAGTSGPATAYHETVTDFRRVLAERAENWKRASERYFGLLHAQPPGETPSAVRAAYAGTLGAYGYSYALAAILGVAEREFGPEVAKRLAFDADEILTNGDFDELNADVIPAVDVKPQGEAATRELDDGNPVSAETPGQAYDPNHEPGLSECGCRTCDPHRYSEPASTTVTRGDVDPWQVITDLAWVLYQGGRGAPNVHRQALDILRHNQITLKGPFEIE